MTTTEDQSAPDDGATIDRLEQLLDDWRGRIDELPVQADLASKDVSETVRSQANTAENAFLAAKNQLARIPRDAGANPRVAAVRRREAPSTTSARPTSPPRPPSGGAGASSRSPERRGRSAWTPPATAWSRRTGPARERDVLAATRGGPRLRGGPGGAVRVHQDPLADVLRLRHAMDRHATRTDPGWALQAVADQLAYDAALIRLARRRGVTAVPADFELPQRGRAALEDALIAKGVNLPGARRPGSLRRRRLTAPVVGYRPPGCVPRTTGLRCRWRQCDARARTARGSGWHRPLPGYAAPSRAWPTCWTRSSSPSSRPGTSPRRSGGWSSLRR